MDVFADHRRQECIGDVVKERIDELESERSTLTGYITGERI